MIISSYLPCVLLMASAAQADTTSADPPAISILQAALNKRAEQDFVAAAALLQAKGSGSTRGRCGEPLEAWCAYYRAEMLFNAGMYAEAASEFAAAKSLDSTGPVAIRALPKEAESLIKAKKPEAAVRLRQALKNNRSPELMLLLAQTLLENETKKCRESKNTCNNKEALLLLKRIWLEHPSHSAAQVAQKALEERGELDSLKFSERLARGERCLAAGMAKEALVSAHQAAGAAHSTQEKILAELARGKALAALKDSKAEKTLQPLLGPKTPNSVQSEAAITLARIAMTQGSPAETISKLDEIIAQSPPEAAADEISFLAAWTFFNSKDYANCSKRFKTFVEKKNRSKKKDDALWYLGFCNRLAGDRQGSDKAMAELEKLSPQLAPQAIYWQARNADSPNAAEPHYRRLIRRAPTTWYAFLAQQQLAQLNLPREPFNLSASTPNQNQTAGAAAPREIRAGLLMRLGLVSEARAEMDAAIHSIRQPADAQRYAISCASIGLHNRAYQLANAKLWGNAFSKADSIALGLLYPKPWAKEVTAAAETVGLDPYFVWAIMRRESAFDPFAFSSAKAVGLMQMLLTTASKVASLAGEEPPNLEALQQPERILPLSTWYLAELAGRFGNAGLAAAAYNGGPKAVSRWLSERSSKPLDEFVELIPFKETRFYVKSVLGDYYTYRSLWSASETPMRFDLTIPKPADGVSF